MRKAKGKNNIFKNINLSTLDHHKMSGMNTNTRQILERDKNIELKTNY